MRTWTEAVKPYPLLVRGMPYTVQVKDVSKIADPKAMEISLEFLEGSQQGRRLQVLLPRPIRPDSLAADFFFACGLAVAPQAKIAPRNAINAILAASFEETEDAQGYRPVSFKKVQKGEHHESLHSES